MAFITALREVKNSVLVQVDNHPFARVPLRWVSEMGLASGQEVDTEELGCEIARRQFAPAYRLALEMLAASAMSRRDLMRKLANKGCCAETLRLITERLEEEGYLSDAGYAANRARVTAARGKSRRAAAIDLRQHGISGEDIDAALADWDEDREKRAALTVARRYLRAHGRAEDAAERRHVRQLCLAALYRRGYSPAICREALETAASELESDEK